jgi:hypothetical protein
VDGRRDAPVCAERVRALAALLAKQKDRG